MLNIRGYREPKERLSDRLPWAALVAPGIVLQKDGTLLRAYRFRGPDLDASTPADFIALVGKANSVLKRLGTGWTLVFEEAKRKAPIPPPSHWPTPASAIVDEERRRRQSLLDSEYFLSFVWGTPTERTRRVVSFLFEEEASTQTGVSIERELEHFRKGTAEAADVLAMMFPVCFEALDSDALLTYLKSTVSSVTQPVKTPEFPMRLDAFLPDVPFCPGETPTLGDQYLSIFTVRGFPNSTFVGMLQQLTQLHYPYRWVTRFQCLDSEDAKARIVSVQRGWLSKQQTIWSHLKELFANERSAVVDPSNDGRIDDTKRALAELGQETVAFGYCTTTLITWARERHRAIEQARAMKKLLRERGLVVVDESLHSLEAWCGTHPGNLYANVRRPLIHTQNLLHMLPLTAPSAGDAENKHLKKVTGIGTPHMRCMAGASPYNFNLFVGDVGNAFIAGPIGSGKSTILAMLALQWLRYPKARVIIYDKDRSARAATLANASVPGFVQYFEPGNPKAPLQFQPLRCIDDPAEFVWAAEFVALLLELQGVKVDDILQNAIDQTLKQMVTSGAAKRTLTRFQFLLSSHAGRPAEALRPYTKVGNYGQIFDGDGRAEGDGSYAPWRMYEMGALMELGEKAVIPAIKYLDRQDSKTYREGSDEPVLKIYDECWRFLQHPTFGNILRNDLKTLRKKNVAIVFATQEVVDAAARPELLSTILSACQTKIYGADASATTPTVAAAYAGFGLAPHELALLANAQPKRDYYHWSSKSRRMFSLNLGPAALALAGASSPKDQRDMDAIIANHAPSEYAHELFARRGVDWAAAATAARTAETTIRDHAGARSASSYTESHP